MVVIAVMLGWWLWNYYMQSPWTRDGKVRAELVSITPEVSGTLLEVKVKDNQYVKKGSELFRIDPLSYQIALDNAQAVLLKAKLELDKASHEASRRRSLPKNTISAEDLDEANLYAQSMQAAYQAAQANLELAKRNLSKTTIYAPTDGYLTNLNTRAGNYATQGVPLVALIDDSSFYVMGYFEETKLRHIRQGDPAKVVLYSGNQLLKGEVESIGRAIYDQSLDNNNSNSLLLEVKPNVPWVRLAQRVPVRIKLLDVPADTVLIAGTTCTITIQP